MTEDIKLLQASQKGDTAAFEKIVEKYQSLICAITFSGTGHLEISEELAQDTFLNAWRNLIQLKDLGNFRNWLCSIARNRLKNYYRRKKPTYVDASHLDSFVEEVPTPSENISIKEELDMLQQALMQIPAEYREPLVLYYRQEKSTRQVAADLGLTESAVRTRLQRARQMLREEIASRLECTLEKTAPGKHFTKAVMVTIGSAAVGLSASAKAAGANAVNTTVTASSNTIAAAMSTVAAKVITAVAVVAVVAGAVILYSRSDSDTPPQIASTETITQNEPASTTVSVPASPESFLSEARKKIDGLTVAPQKPINTPAANVNIEQATAINTKMTAPLAAVTKNPEYVFEPNGVLSGLITDIETGEPVTDAEVTISPGRLYRTATDADGFYHFDTIEKDGDYSIGVYSNEYVGVTDYKEQPRLHLKTTSRTVKHFQLPKACMVNVYVMDEQQNPIKDVRVWTTSLADEHGVEIGRSYVSRRTDENGYIQLGGFKPSETPYMIHALHARSGKMITENGRRYVEQFYDYAPGYAKLVLNNPDVIEYAEIVLGKGESMRGFARYTDGTPADECEIVPYPDWWHSTYSPPSWPIDPNGMFTLEQIIPGTYRIQARVPSGPSSSTGYTLFSLRLPEEKEKLLTLTIPRKPSAEGSLRNAGQNAPRLYGMVMDAATGKPIPNFRLRYKRLGLAHISDEGKWTQYENANGSFTMDATISQPSICQIQAAAEGYAPQWSQRINTEDNQAVLIKLTHGGSITGLVKDSDGNPVADAKVLPYSLAGDVLSANEPVFRTEEGAVMTDSKGRFTLQNLAPGSETLKITHPDFAEKLVSEAVVREDAQNDLGEIVIQKGGTIEGFVYDNNGDPQGGVTVYAQNHYAYSTSEIRYAQVVTDPNGYYHMDNLAETLYYIVRPRSYEQDGVISSAIIPSNTQTTRLDLGGGPVITGQLVIDGIPQGETRITLALGDYVSSGLHRCYTQTDENGRFTVTAGMPGSYALSYERRLKQYVSLTTKLMDIQINPSDELIELGTIPSMNTGLNVWIQASDEQLQTISSFCVMQHDPDEGPIVFWAEDPNSAQMPYTIGLPGPGSYYAVLRGSSGYCTYQYPIEMAPDQTSADLTIPLTAGPVTLTGSLPELINHVRFTNEDNSVSGFLFNNSQTGGFTVENLLPGTYYFCPKWANWQDSVVRTIPNTPRYDLDLDLAELQNKLTERLTVYVFGPDGLPIAKPAVWIQADGQKQMPVYGDDYSGVFYLPAGKYLIHAEKDEQQGTRAYQVNIDPHSTASGESYETWIQLK